jgi:lipopolysaccharide biosynthesis regulator YciM
VSGGSRKVDSPRLEAAFRDALSALLEDDLDGAEAALSALVQQDASPVEVYLLLGQLYRRRGEIARAIRVHQNLLLRRDLDEAHRERALRGLARDFRKGGFLTRAISAYEELRDRRPRDPETLAALARLRADTRDFDGALDAHHRWARASGENGRPGEAALWLERSEAERAEGRGDAARRALAKSLKLARDQALAWLRLGELEAERGKPKKAVAAWQKALDADRRVAALVYPRLEAALAELGGPAGDVEGHQVVGGVGVEHRAHALRGLVDLAVVVVLLAALEHEVLEEVGHAVLVRALGARTGFEGDQDGQGPGAGDLHAVDRQAVREGGALDRGHELRLALAGILPGRENLGR